MAKKFIVKLYPRAYRDLDDIYSYVAKHLQVPHTAKELINTLETAIFSLENLPERGTIRKIGLYTNYGYRQLSVKNFTIIYRVHKKIAEVHIITIRYAASNF